MIIKHSRHPLYHSIEVLLTAFGWLAFFWLISKGILALVTESTAATALSFSPIMPTLSTISAYLMVAAINAGLLALWAQGHRYLTKRQLVDHSAIDHFNASASSLYGLDPSKQNELRANRFSVIYHNPNGHVVHVETAN